MVDRPACLGHEVPILKLFSHWWDRDFGAFHFPFNAFADPVDYGWCDTFVTSQVQALQGLGFR